MLVTDVLRVHWQEPESKRREEEMRRLRLESIDKVGKSAKADGERKE